MWKSFFMLLSLVHFKRTLVCLCIYLVSLPKSLRYYTIFVRKFISSKKLQQRRMCTNGFHSQINSIHQAYINHTWTPSFGYQFHRGNTGVDYTLWSSKGWIRRISLAYPLSKWYPKNWGSCWYVLNQWTYKEEMDIKLNKENLLT